MAKAIIRLDVPDWQIGQEVSIYFPDTMMKRSVCTADERVGCLKCKYSVGTFCHHPKPDFYCTVGVKKDG